MGWRSPIGAFLLTSLVALSLVSWQRKTPVGWNNFGVPMSLKNDWDSRKSPRQAVDLRREILYLQCRRAI